MKPEVLSTHIKDLVSLAESDAPFVSCYVNLMDAPSVWQTHVRERLDGLLQGSSEMQQTAHLTGVIENIWEYLTSPAPAPARGAAVFARGGTEPFWLPLTFSVPIRSWVSVDARPNVYPLVELKDQHQRFIVLLSTKDSARIYEIALGEITQQLWLRRPTLRKHVGREWTRLRYQNHLRERRLRFLREKIEILERFVGSGNHTRLMLAGDPRIAAEIKRAMPARLAACVVDVIPRCQAADDTDDVIAAAIQAFLAAEEKESRAIVDRLFDAYYRHDLAVFGPADTLRCLLRHQADVVVLTQNADLGRCRICPACGEMVAGQAHAGACPGCGESLSLERDTRTEIVRVAALQDRPVETVAEPNRLGPLGGVGCMLRYAVRRSPRETSTV